MNKELRDVFIQNAKDVVREAFRQGLAPTPKLTLSEWADQKRVLSSAESSEPGRWRTDRVPYIKEIMDSLSVNDPTQIVVFMKSTQVAGTEVGVNWAGYIIDISPSPMLAVEPTIELGKLWSKQRFSNMVNNCRDLLAKIPPARSRDGGNAVMLKEYPGGILRVGGANSAVSLRSMPVKYLFLDEIDGYPEDADGEGDPINLAMERQNNFPRRKAFMPSTPTIHGASNVEYWFLQSDQRYYYVPCPHCQHKQRLVQENLRFIFKEGKEGDVDSLIDAQFVCIDCGVLISERHKKWMLENGEWIATYPDRKIRGFHINSFYSPVGLGKTWVERAGEFLRAKGDPNKLKTYINTVLAETWKIGKDEVEPESLQQRAAPYALRTVPEGVLLISAGVDTQDDRLEMYVWGWGKNNRCWLIDRILIMGSPALASTWEQLTKELAATYETSCGIDIRIQFGAIDTGGHFTQDVYRFVRGYRGKVRLFAIKGADNRAFVGRPSKVDISVEGKTISNGMDLWIVGVGEGKSTFYNWLKQDDKPEVEQYFINTSHELDRDFYEQITSEVYDVLHKRWVLRKKGMRNEALDCWVYAYFAVCAPPFRYNNTQDKDWVERERTFYPAIE